MSQQYGALRPTNGWDRFGSLGHRTAANFNGFRVLSSLLQWRHRNINHRYYITRSLSDAHCQSLEANQTLHDLWPSPGFKGLVHYIHFWGVEFVSNRINDDTKVSLWVVTSHNVILLASGDIERHTSIGLISIKYLSSGTRYPTNYPIGYPGNKSPGYASPQCGSPTSLCWLLLFIAFSKM